MKKILLAAMLVVFVGSLSHANYSMLICNAERGTIIQVYLNGKLINKKANDVVRLKSKGGCNSIAVIVYNSILNSNFCVQRDIDIETGYEVYLKIISDDCGPLLSVSRRYPLLNTYSYSKKLYTKRYIS